MNLHRWVLSIATLVLAMAAYDGWQVQQGAMTPAAQALRSGHPVLINDRPWEVVIVPQSLDAGHALVALGYDGRRPLAAPVVRLSWGAYHAGSLVPANLKLTRSMHLTVAWMQDVAYTRTLLGTPLQVAWGIHGPTSHLSLGLYRGKPLGVNEQLYTGETRTWRVGYAQETIPGDPLKLPSGLVRIIYRVPGAIGQYVAYPLGRLVPRGGYPELMSAPKPSRTVQQYVRPWVSGKPLQVSIEIPWRGHQRRVVLTRRTPK